MSAFQDLIQSGTPILVDFHADWCGPCKAMNPIVQEVARITEGNARVIKINIDKNQAAAIRYNVKSVPTFMVFKNGEIVWRHSGMIDQMTLLKQLSI
ncbi:thioredoxin [Pedobacter sp. PLR]|uniref:thioredoxin n=1 Tax=Pedobacter sp. PLR TaxID=2994465 RepID=UPI002245E0A6|nr:thioredoxin [Pedobacter sp. PLR]MCX2451994.1 thioredoxin [Pedobacter sp. PLR]